MDVSPVSFKALAYVLEVEGFDSAAALAQCGLGPIDAWDDHGPWLPLGLFEGLMASAVAVSGDPCFGLVAGKSKGLMRHVTLMQVTLVAPDLRQVITDICHFAPLYLAQSEVQLHAVPGSARILVHPVVRHGVAGRFRTELVATSAAQMVKLARGGFDDILAVDFPYACPPGQAARYAATFGPKVRFGRDVCAVEFNPRLLDLALPTHDPVVYANARRLAEATLSRKGAAMNTAERLRRWLAAALPEQPSMQQAAQRLKLSERSLRRQLAASGVNYAQLTQQCHQAVAQQLLAGRSLSLKQVADRLGFSSVASFHRAFRRWTGTTPHTWRDTAPDDPHHGA